MSRILLEVCVADAESLDAAIEGGADRIELCSALELGGLTPSPGLMRYASRAPIPVYAMIRPRSGDFVFSEPEAEIMLADIDSVRRAGLAGVVLGASRRDGRLDIDLLSRLSDAGHGLGKSLHRAFDLVPDIADAVNTAILLGFERILTSGRAATAAEGIDDLARTERIAAGRISIMPGSGIGPQTIGLLAERLSPHEVHASCAAPVAQHSQAVRFGFAQPTRRLTSVESVRALRQTLDALAL